jgi:hypothetical protein
MAQLFDGSKVHRNEHNKNDQMPAGRAIFISTKT